MQNQGLLVADCPRCGTKHITFEAQAAVETGTTYNWKTHWEVFCVCRACNTATIFELALENSTLAGLATTGWLLSVPSLNDHVSVEGYVSAKNFVSVKAPSDCPPNVAKAFNEAAACLSLGCYNAAAAMFRLALDLATEPLLPSSSEPGLKHRTRRDLALRLAWLFEHAKLPPDVAELSDSVREDGNDGAHRGTMGQADADDLLDFSLLLFQRMYSVPARIKDAKMRRGERRKQKEPEA